MHEPDPLLTVLREARALVARPGNDFTWSSWRDTAHALEEIDGFASEVEAATVEIGWLAVLFAPTGPMQELAVSSGWGEEFLALAERFDGAAAAARPRRFECSICAETAGTIAIHDGELRRESFTSTLTQPVSAQLAAQVGRAGAAALHAIDPELAPFYCPECDAVYCGEHWRCADVFEPGEASWHDSIRGTCPRGHERLLED